MESDILKNQSHNNFSNSNVTNVSMSPKTPMSSSSQFPFDPIYISGYSETSAISKLGPIISL